MELYHHGILGQRWGIRRYQNEDGSLTEAGLKRYRTNKKFRATIDRQNAEKERAASKKISEMSDQELVEKINRLRLEDTYAQLMKSRTPKVPPSTADKVKDFIGKTGSKFASTVSDQLGSRLGKSLVNKVLGDDPDDKKNKDGSKKKEESSKDKNSDNKKKSQSTKDDEKKRIDELYRRMDSIDKLDKELADRAAKQAKKDASQKRKSQEKPKSKPKAFDPDDIFREDDYDKDTNYEKEVYVDVDYWDTPVSTALVPYYRR